MPGARSLAKEDARIEPQRIIRKRFKRAGNLSKAEKQFVAQIVQDQPRPLQVNEINSLAKVMRRSRETIKQAVEDARDNFVVSAGRYVDIHKQATEQALTDGDNETALKGSQWYLEHVGAEGVQIVDKAKAVPSGNKIMIGIKIGGIDSPTSTIDIPNE